MPQRGVQHCLREFDQRVQASLVFLQEAPNFRVRQPNGHYNYIGQHRIEQFAGLALLDIHLAWEEFLENVFLRYMCGAHASSGYAPSLLFSPERRIAAAFARLLPSGQNFLDWNAHQVLNRARIYFDQGGEPFFTAISAARQTISDISIVRNRFAHRSDYAAQNFRRLVLREFGHIPRGINPGRFLLTTHASPAAGGQRYLEFYANVLLGAGNTIVP